jgi:hypothetical protein
MDNQEQPLTLNSLLGSDDVTACLGFIEKDRPRIEDFIAVYRTDDGNIRYVSSRSSHEDLVYILEQAKLSILTGEGKDL